MKPVPNPAWFKQLTAKRQGQLWHWLNGDAEKKILPLSHKEVIAKIKKLWGIKIGSASSLSAFYAWYPLLRELHEATTFKEEIEEFISQHPDLDLDAEKVSQIGQLIFEKQAIRKRDGKLFVGLRRLRQEDVKLLQEREEFEVRTCELFLKWWEDKRAVAIATMQVSHREKISRLRKAFFKDVEKAEKSGEVELPGRAGQASSK